MNGQDMVNVLNTLYDNVKKCGNNDMFAIEHAEKYGLASVENGVVAEPIYLTAIYRGNYTIFSTVRQFAPTDTQINRLLKVIFYSDVMNDIELPITAKIKEHSANNYEILTIINDGIVRIYSTKDGKEIIRYKETKEYRFRGQCNYIMLAYLDENNIMMGMTNTFEKGTIDELLKKKYNTVEYDKRYKRYKITDGDEVFTLNRFGQLYWAILRGRKHGNF